MYLATRDGKRRAVANGNQMAQGKFFAPGRPDSTPARPGPYSPISVPERPRSQRQDS
jgi:hypothetical protein